MDDSEHKASVRRGYDAVSYHYRADGDDDPGERAEWIDRLVRRLPAGGDVLDLACGCGVRRGPWCGRGSRSPAWT